MFIAKVKLVDEKVERYRIRTYCDTLYEAEIYLYQALGMRFNSKEIIMIYEHDLIYSVYDYDDLVCTIEIILGD